jgi:gliding motility-associated-like protein
LKYLPYILLIFSATAHGQIINTFAGNGVAGYSGDGGPATKAQLNNPNGVAADANGNIYIADFHNNRIRKVTPAGSISTIAGTVVQGYNGDGIPATTAELNAPWGITTDHNGNIYFADLHNNRIRKIDPTGIITTVAGNGTYGYNGDGGPATTATLSHPNDVAIDASGNLYIADYDNNCIRKVNTAGTISTFAGTGSLTAGYSGDGGPANTAELGAPVGIATDNSGNVYIADEGNSRIRMVTPAGIISTVAGNGHYGFSGDGGPAIAAELSNPVGISADGLGNLYISDNFNNRIRKVTSSGAILTLAGNGTGAYSGDGGPATDAALNAPWGVAIDGAGTVYISDYLNNRIRIIACTPSSGAGAISGDSSLCPGATINLSDTSKGGEWMSGNTSVATINSTNGAVTGLARGTATITYRSSPNAFGCSSFTTLTLSVMSFDITGTIIPVTCYGYNNGGVTLAISGGSGHYKYAWSNTGSSYYDNGLSAGIYKVRVTDSATQCVVTDSFTVTQPDSLLLTPFVIKDHCHSASGSINTSVTGGVAPYNYLWSNNSMNQSISGLSSGDYSLSVTDRNGCEKNYSIRVDEDTCVPVIIHDVITPNGDGFNDVWMVEGIENFPGNKVQVYDKWGNMVYEKSDYNNNWGGRGNKGDLLPDGTYFYLIKLNAVNSKGEPHEFTGAILIKR